MKSACMVVLLLRDLRVDSWMDEILDGKGMVTGEEDPNSIYNT